MEIAIIILILAGIFIIRSIKVVPGLRRIRKIEFATADRKVKTVMVTSATSTWSPLTTPSAMRSGIRRTGTCTAR